MVRFARGSCEGTLCVPGKNLEDPVLSSDGQEQSGQKKKKKKSWGGRHFTGRGKEDWQEFAKGCPSFPKTLQGSINAMYSGTSIDLSF